MKVALLVCDHVDKHLVPEHGSYVEIYQKFFENIDLHPYRVCDGYFPMISDYDAFICTGSRYSVYDDLPWIKSLISFTKRVDKSSKKFLGICFGHQIIAQALGGSVERADDGFLIGIHQFDIVQRERWMENDRSNYKVLMLCQDQVKILPKNGRILSENHACPVGMLKVGKYFLGIQGHPEYAKSFVQAVFESRADRIGKEKIAAGIKSLEDSPDDKLLQRYLMLYLST